jgi:hypothetical protein
LERGGRGGGSVKAITRTASAVKNQNVKKNEKNIKSLSFV